MKHAMHCMSSWPLLATGCDLPCFVLITNTFVMTLCSTRRVGKRRLRVAVLELISGYQTHVNDDIDGIVDCIQIHVADLPKSNYNGNICEQKNTHNA